MAIASRALLALCILTLTAAARAQTPTAIDPDHPNITVTPDYFHDNDAKPAPAPPPLPDVWGALAISPALGWGYSWNFKSQAAAEADALKRCNAVSKNGPCKVAVSVADVCVSLATSLAEKVYTIGGPTGAANYADAAALLKCQRAGGKSCVIKASFCADGVRHITPMQDTPVPGRRR